MTKHSAPYDLETTGEIAKHLLTANRRSRSVIVIGIIIVLAIFLFWFMMGRRNCQEKFGNGSFPTPTMKPPSPEDEKAWIVNPDSPTARVTIALTGSGPLTIDGVFADLPMAKLKKKGAKDAPPEPPRSIVVELTPGGHLLASEIKGAVVQQYLTVRAGEEFKVTFEEATKDVRLERIPPPKK